MRTWTNILPLAALAVLFTLTLAGCAEDGPVSMIETDTITPGDPVIYAPDGWPLQIGDRISIADYERLFDEFQLPGIEPRAVPLNPGARDGRPWSSPWTRRGPAMNLVGGRVYAALIEYAPKVGEYDRVYRGHFPRRFKDFMRHYEPDLPSEYHGKVEYYPTVPLTSAPPVHIVVDPDNPVRDADGKRLRLDPDWTPYPINRSAWPDYAERRK
ncbi:MAG: hypothetical protein OXI79_09605 [Gammaproteobacteria bacterium]|nr:hypothetical protein [Gammaproteobacteria bacterium]